MTECWECARILGVQQGGLPDGVLPDVELFDLKIQRRPRNSEFDSRAIWSSNYSITFCKSCLDNLTLSVSARSNKWNSRAVPYLLGLALRRGLACGLQARRTQDILRAKNYAPFDKVLELANVPGP